MTDKTFEKYKRVIDEFLVNGENGAAAYRSVYPKAKTETAKVKFAELVTFGNVKEYLQSERQRLAEKAEIKKQDFVKRILRALEVDPLDFLGIEEKEVTNLEGGPETIHIPYIKNLKDIPIEVRRMVTSIKVTTKGIELKFYSKEKAADQLIQMLGFNAPEKLQIEKSVNINLNVSSDDLKSDPIE